MLTNANVIDATGAPVQVGMTLVIDGNVISSHDTRPLHAATGEEDEIIDLAGALCDAGLLETCMCTS